MFEVPHILYTFVSDKMYSHHKREIPWVAVW